MIYSLSTLFVLFCFFSGDQLIARQFHLLGHDQSTVAQQAEMTVVSQLRTLSPAMTLCQNHSQVTATPQWLLH